MLTYPAATPGLIVAINMSLNFIFGAGLGASYAFFCEAFPKSVRSSGLSIAYALGTTVFGGTTQFVVAWLIHVTGNPLVPAWYQIVANVVSIVAIMLLTPHAEILRERSVHVPATAG
jgi:MHS family proline/betaine transporter-like MFS transporter